MKRRIHECVVNMINEIGRLRDYGIDLDSFPPELLEARNLLRTLDAQAATPDVSSIAKQALWASVKVIHEGERAVDAASRDWTEDAHLENGNYQCICYGCDETFIGHKRRVVCRRCTLPPQAVISPTLRAQLAEAVAEHAPDAVLVFTDDRYVRSPLTDREADELYGRVPLTPEAAQAAARFAVALDCIYPETAPKLRGCYHGLEYPRICPEDRPRC